MPIGNPQYLFLNNKTFTITLQYLHVIVKSKPFTLLTYGQLKYLILIKINFTQSH
jgi:hypothetical protein